VLRILPMLTLHEVVAIEVTATSLERDWATYEPLFDASLRSLTVVT
jgi:hypothetical protein